MSRVDPFANLDEFTPKTTSKAPIKREEIDRLAEDNGFPSRNPQLASVAPAAPAVAPTRRAQTPHRYTTGRNQQFNIKATPETVDRFYRMHQAMGVPLGEVLERAIAALEKELARAGRDDQ